MADVASPIIDLVVDMLPVTSSSGTGPTTNFLIDFQPITRGAGPIDNFNVDLILTRRGGPVVAHLADIGLSRAAPIADHRADIGVGRAAPITDLRISFLVQPPIGGPLCDHLVKYAPLITPLDPNAVNPPEQAIPVPSRLSSAGTGIVDLSPGTFGIEFMGNIVTGPGANN